MRPILLATALLAPATAWAQALPLLQGPNIRASQINNLARAMAQRANQAVTNAATQAANAQSSAQAAAASAQQAAANAASGAGIPKTTLGSPLGPAQLDALSNVTNPIFQSAIVATPPASNSAAPVFSVPASANRTLATSDGLQGAAAQVISAQTAPAVQPAPTTVTQQVLVGDTMIHVANTAGIQAGDEIAPDDANGNPLAVSPAGAVPGFGYRVGVVGYVDTVNNLVYLFNAYYPTPPAIASNAGRITNLAGSTSTGDLSFQNGWKILFRNYSQTPLANGAPGWGGAGLVVNEIAHQGTAVAYGGGATCIGDNVVTGNNGTDDAATNCYAINLIARQPKGAHGTAYGMEMDVLTQDHSTGGNGIEVGTSGAPYGNGFAYAAVGTPKSVLATGVSSSWLAGYFSNIDGVSADFASQSNSPNGALLRDTGTHAVGATFNPIGGYTASLFDYTPQLTTGGYGPTRFKVFGDGSVFSATRVTAPAVYQTATDGLSGTGTSQTGATQLPAGTVYATCTAAANALLLPSTANLGQEEHVYNSGAVPCQLFPQSGQQIGFALAPNVPYPIPAYVDATFVLRTATQWMLEGNNGFGSSYQATGSVAVGASLGHRTLAYHQWAFSPGTFTLTLDGNTPGAGNELPTVPNAAAFGDLMVTADIQCASSAGIESWHVSGNWLSNSSGTLSLNKALFVQSTDGQSPEPTAWTPQGGVDTTNNRPLLQIATGNTSASVECGADVRETIVQ